VKALFSGLKIKPSKKYDGLKMEAIFVSEMPNSLQPAWSYNKKTLFSDL
jgi:hypothetical protein